MQNKIKNEIDQTDAVLKWARKQNVSDFKRFMETKPEKPLICIGSGGSFSTCKFIALMYSTRKGLGTAVTPYSVYSISEEVLKSCKILLVSNSGHNKDITAIAKRCMQTNPEWTANLTTNDGAKNDLKKIISSKNSFNYVSGIKDFFISVNSVTANYALALQAFKSDLNADIKFSDYQSPVNFKNTNHFMILYGGWGEPAAIDLESKLVESGMATCAVSDYRNFCHGRFIFASNHCGHDKKVYVPDDNVVVMLETPRELSFADKILKILPKNCKVIILQSLSEGAEASLELMIRASLLAGEIAAQKGVNPLSPPNYGSMDKRYPTQIPFISDLKKAGPMKI